MHWTYEMSIYLLALILIISWIILTNKITGRYKKQDVAELAEAQFKLEVIVKVVVKF